MDIGCRSELILEEVWGTPGPTGMGVYKKLIRRDEFEPVHEKGLGETIIHCSLQEFVLTS